MSPKQLNRLVEEFVGKHHLRELVTVPQMRLVYWKLLDKRLKYGDLIGNNEMDWLARSSLELECSA